MSVPQALLAGRYRLVSVVATGGMGVVWEAWDERLERSVAIKQLRTVAGVPEAEAELAKDRAMREARITARLHHPHAVPVFDAVEHEGQPCLIMPFLPATPLSAVLRERGRLPLRDAVQVGAQVASALAAAHALGIVHRDVKPGNILITPDGSAHISDFGISHAMGDATLTRSGLVHGTPAYLAPEVARGDEAAFPADVFSLGSTLYAALEGAPPFGAEANSIALLHKVAAARVPPPTRAGTMTPFLLSMLSSDAEARPTMEEVAAFLEAFTTGTDSDEETVSVLPPPVPTEVAPGAPVPGETTQELEPVSRPETSPAAAPGGETASVMPWWSFTRGGGAHPPEPDPSAESTAEPPPARQAAPLAAPVAAPPPETAAPSDPTAPDHPAREPRRPSPTIVFAAAAALLVAVLLVAATLTDQLRPGSSEGPERAAATTSPVEADGDAAGSPRATPPVVPPPGPARTTTAEPDAEQDAPAESQSQDQGADPDPEPATEPGSGAEPPSDGTAEPSADTGAQRASEPASPDRATRLSSAVTDYYALMPENTEAAWTRMTADYQNNHAGGRASYEAFWADIADVAVSDVEATPPDQVVATLTYSFHSGRVDVERTAYRLVDDGGVLKIAATDVLSSRSG